MDVGEYTTILDRFSQKLLNSGYSVDQIRRMVVAGIKGWSDKVTRCKEEGRRLRKTAGDSLGLRMRTKLVGKTTWFKRRGGAKKDGCRGSIEYDRKKTDETRRSNTTSSIPKSSLFVDQTPGGSWHQG